MYTMLTQPQTEEFAKKYKTLSDNVLKEHYQVYLLDILFDSKLGESLVFKGGTALKLVYHSFRFSEDLDFSLIKNINFGDFKQLISKIPVTFPEAKIKDIYNKKYTLFAKICFAVNYKPIPIGVKVEINKEFKKGGYQAMVIRSDFNNLVVTGNVFTPEEILKDKKELLKKRREPRDLFDLWYLSQTLNKKLKIPQKEKYGKKEISDRLNPFIPQNHKNILNLFVK